jgi:hypothetical protein
MKPPSVYDVTTPRSQRIRRITAMVTSIRIDGIFADLYPAYSKDYY